MVTMNRGGQPHYGQPGFRWNSFNATKVAEQEWDMVGIEESPKAFIEANQYLIDNGIVERLSAALGRQANILIAEGYCHARENANAN
jgi:hypothetical protein